MRAKKGHWSRSKETRPLRPSKEEQPLRSFNSQVAREEFTDVWNTDTDSDDELSWDEEVEYRSYTVKKKGKSEKGRLQRLFKCLMVLAVAVIAILAGVIVWQYIRGSNKKEICQTAECVQTSAYILSKMDLTVEPCQDFYQYTCGNWLKTTKIPSSRPKYNIFSEIDDKNSQKVKLILETEGSKFLGNFSNAIDKAKHYYKLCMDENTIEKMGINPVIKFIKFLGSWTVTSAHGVAWQSNSWKLLQHLTTSHGTGFNAFFNMGVSVDDKDSSQYIIQFIQGGLTLRSREEYFTNHSNYQKIKDGFMNFSSKIGELLGGNATTIHSQMLKVYELETKLAKIFVPKEELLNPEKIYHKVTITDFQKMIGQQIDVRSYLKRLFNKDFGGDSHVLVYTPSYFRELGTILSQTEKSTLANYIVWNAVNSQVGYFSSEFVEAGLLLSKAESGVKSLDPRWRRCITKVIDAYGFASSALYVQEHFAKESKENVKHIVKEIKEAFKRGMPLVSWMDARTREKAIKKVNKVVDMIGYPDWILNTSKLDKYYKNYTITDGEFFTSHLSNLRAIVDRNFRRLEKTPNRAEWSMKPVETNAYYSTAYNNIVFPAAILQQPFYSPKFPMSFNFGTTGMIIGHELTHGFDNKGRHFDEFGNLDSWWSKESAAKFKEHTRCMVNQYSNYTAENTHLKGERVLGENIADNGGLKTAYSAYKNWLKSQKSQDILDYPGLHLTQEQLFFVGFGQLWCSYYTPQYAKTAILTDEHTIGKFRTIGTVSNSGDFARAFNCAPNTPMNPRTKCQVW